jgi:DNA-binding NtrC family response regulator
MKSGAPLMLGRSAAFMAALDVIQRTARCDVPVLIVGETGTGKELAARAIHYGSCRRHAPFVPLNCGAVPESLCEAELFGAERGAYTDARQGRSGLVAAAEGGTLFLDEVDSLPHRAQVALLRFLQDLIYRPVGATRECQADVRIIAAASPRLHGMLESGEFRDDLAFRLGVLEIEMPPLRCREGDARLLATHFVTQYVAQYDLRPRHLHTKSLEWLDHQAWPGNVRELDNRVRRALLLCDDTVVHLEPVVASAASTAMPSPGAVASTRACAPFNDARELALLNFERQYLEQLMQLSAGNVTRAAGMAGKERRQLGRLLKKHGLGHSASSALA